MRSSHLLAQLALWASSVSAFYPYRPEWLGDFEKKRALGSRSHTPRARSDGKGVTVDIKSRSSQFSAPVPERAAREAERLAKKYHNSADDLPRTSKRQSGNQYDVLDADDPGSDDAEGIDQDGTDYSYFIQVKLGSEQKEVRMLIDTGAGNTWVMGPDCQSEACSLHDSFGPDDSDTFKASDKVLSVSYGTGEVQGYFATDTINVAGLSFEFEFGIANETSDDFVSFVFDGILGLAATGNNQKFLDVLADSGEVEANLFGVSLHRAADGGNNDGEISFGTINKGRFEGDITYADLGTENGEWAVELDDASYNGNAANVGGVLAYIDTGTTFMFGPEELVRSLHSAMPDATTSDGVSYRVPCDSDALVFTFAGTDFAVSPKDWVSPPNDRNECTSNVYGQEVVAGAWLLGAAFLKNVYAVFDRDGMRIGFARHAGEGAPSATTSELAATATTAEPSGSTSTDVEATTTRSGTDTSSRPSMGVGGQDSDGPSETDTSDSSEPTDDDETDASSIVIASTAFAGSVCIATVFALLL